MLRRNSSSFLQSASTTRRITFSSCSSSFTAKRSIFAGPGGLKGGQSSQATLAHGIHESQIGTKNINERDTTRARADFSKSNRTQPGRERKRSAEEDSKDPNVLNKREDSRRFGTTDPFQQQEKQMQHEAKYGGRTTGLRNKEGMMFYEEKDSPEFHDPYFKEAEEEKRKMSMKVESAADRRMHPIRGMAQHAKPGEKMSFSDAQEQERIRKFQDHLEEEYQYLNKKAEQRNKDASKRNPGKTLKGSTVEARKKAQETYDYYYMNPDETISRPVLWAITVGIVFTFVWFDGIKSVTSPLWTSAKYPQVKDQGLNFDAPRAGGTTMNPMSEKMRRLELDSAAANPLHKATLMNPLHITKDIEIHDVTTRKSIVQQAAEKEEADREKQKEESDNLGMNLNLIGRTKVGL